MDAIALYICDSCSEEIELAVDRSMGDRQEFVEDCPICCRANVIRIEIDARGEPSARAELE